VEKLGELQEEQEEECMPIYLREEDKQRMAEAQRQEEERNTTKYKIDANGFSES
jgi:hypothetical protein